MIRCRLNRPVKFENDADGDKAIEMHNNKLEFGGRLVRVEWSTGRGGGGGRGRGELVVKEGDHRNQLWWAFCLTSCCCFRTPFSLSLSSSSFSFSQQRSSQSQPQQKQGKKVQEIL